MTKIFIHYFDDIYKYIVDEDFYKQYIIKIDERIDDIYYIRSYLNINTTNEDFIQEIECRYNPD